MLSFQSRLGSTLRLRLRLRGTADEGIIRYGSFAGLVPEVWGDGQGEELEDDRAVHRSVPSVPPALAIRKRSNQVSEMRVPNGVRRADPPNHSFDRTAGNLAFAVRHCFAGRMLATGRRPVNVLVIGPSTYLVTTGESPAQFLLLGFWDCQLVGLIFWLSRKRFVESYFLLRATSLSCAWV